MHIVNHCACGNPIYGYGVFTPETPNPVLCYACYVRQCMGKAERPLSDLGPAGGPAAPTRPIERRCETCRWWSDLTECALSDQWGCCWAEARKSGWCGGWMEKGATEPKESLLERTQRMLDRNEAYMIWALPRGWPHVNPDADGPPWPEDILGPYPGDADA